MALVCASWQSSLNFQDIWKWDYRRAQISKLCYKLALKRITCSLTFLSSRANNPLQNIIVQVLQCPTHWLILGTFSWQTLGIFPKAQNYPWVIKGSLWSYDELLRQILRYLCDLKHRCHFFFFLQFLWVVMANSIVRAIQYLVLIQKRIQRTLL